MDIFYKKNTKVLLVALSLFLIFHFINLSASFVNYEYAFSLAADSWLNPKKYQDAMGHYWQVQANPLGLSYIMFLFFKVFPFAVEPWSARLISLGLGVSLLGILPFIVNFFGRHEDKHNIYAMVLVGTNPLIWIFSGRLSADLAPVALFIISLCFLMNSKKNAFFFWASSLSFMVAVIVKYHSAFLGVGPLYIMFLLNYSQLDVKYLKQSLKYFSLPILGLVIYLVYIYKSYGIYILPDRFKSIHGLGFHNVLSTFYQYGFYVSILLGPLSFFPLYNFLKRGERVKKILIILGLILVSFYFTGFIDKAGEMNFSIFNKILPATVLSLIQILNFILFLFILFDICITAKNGDKYSRFVLLSLVPLFSILILSRPAQRYLVFLVPFMIFYLITRYFKKGTTYKVLVGISLTYFLSISFVSVSYHLAQSKSVRNMMSWIKEEGLIAWTNPDTLRPYIAHEFLKYTEQNPKKYRVVLQINGQEVLHEEQILLLNHFKLKTLYFVKEVKPQDYNGR